MRTNTKAEIFRPKRRTNCNLPLYTCPISAGFPSPADDYLEAKLDLNQYLIKHSVATFFLRVSSDSMIGAGIHEGDLLIVDRSISIRLSSRLSWFNSCRSSEIKAPSGEPSWSILACFTQLLKALGVKPISLATWFIGLPDYFTILTASTFYSAVNMRFFLGVICSFSLI
jgi:hypothetical protein